VFPILRLDVYLLVALGDSGQLLLRVHVTEEHQTGAQRRVEFGTVYIDGSAAVSNINFKRI
jgi:hypothetical protein